MPCDLRCSFAGLTLQNPVMVASGTFGYGREYADVVAVDQLGAVIVKGVSLEPWPGNPPPRIAETPSGMLNAIGLQNPGVDAFIEHDLPWLQARSCAVVVNVIGRSVEEYAAVSARLDRAEGVDALELNVSCPNIKEGGMSFGSDPEAAASVVRAVRDVTRKPIIPKLSPNVTDIVRMAQAVEAAGADAISLVNTFLAMKIDVRMRRPILANVMGGLSGPAIRPIAVRMVWEVYRAVGIPLLGMGGISGPEDALEFFLAGASAVAVGTATFARPDTTQRVLRGLAAELDARGETLRDLIGAAQRI